MDDDKEQHSDEEDLGGKKHLHAFHAKVQSDAEQEHEAVNRIRAQHRLKSKKAKKKPGKNKKAVKKKLKKKKKKTKKIDKK